MDNVLEFEFSGGKVKVLGGVSTLIDIFNSDLEALTLGYRQLWQLAIEGDPEAHEFIEKTGLPNITL